jgi:hypothetical protein
VQEIRMNDIVMVKGRGIGFVAMIEWVGRDLYWVDFEDGKLAYCYEAKDVTLIANGDIV